MKDRGHRDEYVGLDDDVEPDPGARTDDQQATATAASDQGAGSLGFAGTARKGSVTRVAGLTTLAGDGFDGAPTVPMMPGTWTREASTGKSGHGEDSAG